jgi:AraC family transcriptional regulator
MSFKPLFGEGQIRAKAEKTEAPRALSWMGSSVVFDHRRWICREAELRWTASHHLIVLTEGGSTSRTTIQSEARSLYDGRDRPGVLTFVPAGAERQGYYRDVDLSYCALWIDPELELPGCERLGNLPIAVNTGDGVIGPLLSSLRAEIEEGRKLDTAYIEHLVALVSLRVAALNRVQFPAVSHGTLSRRTLARIREYVDVNLASDISLTELAAAADMTVDAFARRFKATTGLAPYAYVIAERIQRAEALLRETNMSIGAIAFRLGFSSQSHFATTFRRLRGITPRVYRTHFSPES